MCGQLVAAVYLFDVRDFRLTQLEVFLQLELVLHRVGVFSPVDLSAE